MLEILRIAKGGSYKGAEINGGDSYMVARKELKLDRLKTVTSLANIFILQTVSGPTQRQS